MTRSIRLSCYLLALPGAYSNVLVPEDATSLAQWGKYNLNLFGIGRKSVGDRSADSPAATEVVPDINNATSIGDSYKNTRWHAKIAKFWAKTGKVMPGWGAVSGPGSTAQASKPFIEWLPPFMREHNVTSMVEASSGHWPSGWQLAVAWPPLQSYVGVDVQPEVVEANKQLLASGRRLGELDTAHTEFKEWDMLKQSLPAADLLLVKDTLIHFPNPAIAHFLNLSVTVCPPRFKYVLFLHDYASAGKANLGLNHIVTQVSPENDGVPIDQVYGGQRPVDLGAPPFDLPVETLLRYQEGGRMLITKKVQLLQPPLLCKEKEAGLSPSTL